MAEDKQVRKGRPLYVLELLIHDELKKYISYSTEDSSEHSLNTIFAQQQSVSFPILCTNLKKAVMILSYMSGNIFYNNHPITFTLPSYEKIRDDINTRETHRFGIVAKTTATLPKISTDVNFELTRGFQIGSDATIAFRIERKYAV